MKTILHIENLRKEFGEFAAVDGINLSLNAGEIFGFLGPNGAGKTTTIKMIAGLLLPTSGSITICGESLKENPLFCKAKTGYIPDRPFIYEKLTALEYLSFVASLYRREQGDSERFLQEAEEYLALFDLSRWKEHLIEGFSHGMRQKLIMSSIFMLQTPLMVVDEPMVGLDPKSARIVKELFKARCRKVEGSAVFLSTHSMEIAEELCDRIAIINNGRISAIGTVEQLREQAESGADGGGLEDIFFELTGAQELQSIIAALQSNKGESSKGEGSGGSNGK